MLTLVVIGLLSGVVTALSPCVLPVLPGVLSTSALPAEAPDAGTPPDRRRPFVIVAGLVTSFAALTLLGGALLSALGLPTDLLRTAGIVLLVVVGVGLLIPAVGHLLERPFSAFSRLSPRRDGSAFVFGATFGVVFVPCAGPVLAAITALAAANEVRFGLVLLTLAFSVGVAIPLLFFAIAGQRMAERITAVRTRLPLVRRVTGGILIATALAITLGVADQAQRLVPNYVASAQRLIEDSEQAQEALGALQPGSVEAATAPTAPAPSATVDVDELGSPISFNECEADPTRLANCGEARPFTGIQQWLNTPDGKALTLEGLRGKVVLVDFWTFGCINCQRTLPYLTDWDAKYRDDGLVIVGVHSPEFAHEREVDNVIERSAELGVTYPIAIDNEFRTWRAYNQRFWPAQYLVDRNGVVRQVHYGEGAYEHTERLIQQLLTQVPTAQPISG